MRVLLDRPVLTIGRGADADVAIPHPEVSRKQLYVERQGEGWVATDLSGRGTAIGGSPTDRALLREGMEIQLGDWIATFRAEGREAEATRLASVAGETREVRAASSARGPLHLRVRCGMGERLLPLREETSVGTDRDCALVVDDPYASARHCVLTPTPRGLRLRDLGSTNGTWVGGVRIEAAELSPGTTFRIGESELCFQAEEKTQSTDYEGIVSEAPAMREVFHLLDRVAPSVVPVCILGETGTGKELVARALHTKSERSKGPFIPVNCAAISRDLVESELFGHEKGAFTGAVSSRKGAFEEASRGTIFLDEVGELPLEMQAKLLRTLESGEIRRVGSSRPFRVDARIVAATHRDLRAMVQRGAFREDLYYRLTVVRVELPPLRARGSDLRLLADHLLRHYAPGSVVPPLSDEAWAKLEAHTWPGNVRELRNVIARAMLLRKGSTITGDDLIFDSPAGVPSPTTTDSDESLSLLGKTLAEIEREATLKALRRHKGNRRAAARELGLARSTLQLRAKELGVPPPAVYSD